MKLEFDSLGELDAFIQYVFAGRVAAASPAAKTPHGESPVPDAHLTPEQCAASQAELDAEALAAPRDKLNTVASPSAEAAPAQTEPEPPKRKRRTKAELAAAADAAARADADNRDAQTDSDTGPTDGQATTATSPLAGANPFDVSTDNSPAAAAALSEAPAGTTGTLAALDAEARRVMDDVHTELSDKLDAAKLAAKHGATIDAAEYIAQRVAELGGAFDAREHMKKCVEFINALGKAKYDEAFTLAGTSRAVASYTPLDCAKHIAALEYLQIAG